MAGTNCDLSSASHGSTGILSTRTRFTAVLSNDMTQGCPLPRVCNTMDELKSLLITLPHFLSSSTRQEWQLPPNATHNREQVHEFGWVHCMGLSHEETSTLLSWLPLNMSTYQSVLVAPTDDVLEYFPRDGCVFLAIAARPSCYPASHLRRCADAGDEEDDSTLLSRRPGPTTVDLNDRVYVYVLAFENAIISFAHDHFAGEDDLFGLVMRSRSGPTASSVGAAVCRPPLTQPANVHVDSLLSGHRDDDASAKLVAVRTCPDVPSSPRSADMMCGEYERSNIAYIFSAIVCSITHTAYSQLPALLVRSEHMDDMILEVETSVFDEPDMFLRIKEIRNTVSMFHVEMLLKERLFKHLLLPALRHTAVCRDAAAVENYRRAATSSRNAIKKLRRCRDLVNMSNMNLINGVASRLLRFANVMDYINNIQTRIALVVAPVSIIPAMWAVNIAVPFADLQSLKPFIVITTITMVLLFFGVGYSVVGYFTYHAPGPLVNMFKQKA